MPARRALPALGVAAVLAVGLSSARAGDGAGLPPLRDVARESAAAAARGQPLVVVFTMKDCGYCEAARRAYLQPLQQEGLTPVREVDIFSEQPLLDDAGRRTTAREWAARMKAAPVPMVVVLGRDGCMAAPPLRGYNADFYGAYFDTLLAAGRKAVTAPAGGS